VSEQCVAWQKEGWGPAGSKCTGVVDAGTGRRGRGSACMGRLGEELACGPLLLWARPNMNSAVS
jgi:hypothetical protein